MFDLFRNKEKTRKVFEKTWRPILDEACSVMPENLPALSKTEARFFIDEWNRCYENASEDQRIGLAVLAYRLDIHRYAAGMLIDSKSEARLAGIRMLGYMRDESAWPVLLRLLDHPDNVVVLTSLAALFLINQRRAQDELGERIRASHEWSIDSIARVLEPVCGREFVTEHFGGIAGA